MLWMGYDNGEETSTKKMQRKTPKIEQTTTMANTQEIWGIYGYLPFKISILSLIYSTIH